LSSLTRKKVQILVKPPRLIALSRLNGPRRLNPGHVRLLIFHRSDSSLGQSTQTTTFPFAKLFQIEPQTDSGPRIPRPQIRGPEIRTRSSGTNPDGCTLESHSQGSQSRNPEHKGLEKCKMLWLVRRRLLVSFGETSTALSRRWTRMVVGLVWTPQKCRLSVCTSHRAQVKVVKPNFWV
jgi:hypothetical protein